MNSLLQRAYNHDVPDTKPVYALVGVDAFLQLQALRNITASMPPDAQRADFDGERAELSAVLDELRSFSMFGSGKIVVVTGADAFVTKYREQLESYVEKPSTSATLVLRMTTLPANQRIYKAIAKVGKVESCEPPKDLARWAIDRGKIAHQIVVMPDAARLLADLIGDDMGRLDNELAKLALTCTAGKVVTADVSGGVAFQREREMSELTNAVAAGRSAEAIRRWRQLLQSDPSSEFRAVTWLTIWITNARKALAMKKTGMAPPAIASALRLWPRDTVQAFFETITALGEDGVNRAIHALTEVDLHSKSGVGSPATNVERFILSLADVGSGR